MGCDECKGDKKCNVTKKELQEAKNLPDKMDYLEVIGGRNVCVTCKHTIGAHNNSESSVIDASINLVPIEFIKFWKSLFESKVTINNNFLKLKDAFWINNVEKVLVRKAYIDLKKIIFNNNNNNNNNNKSCLILGTPGVGKSIFLRWLISSLVEERGNSIITFRIKFLGLNEDYYCTTSNPNNVTIYKNQVVDYYFSDSSDISNATGTMLTLLVSSDDDRHHKEFLKSCQLILCMPVFDFDEISSLAPATMTKEEIQFRYDVVGGIARKFYGAGTGNSREVTMMKFVEEKLDWFFCNHPVTKLSNWDDDIKVWALNTITTSILAARNEKKAKLVFSSLFKFISVDKLYLKSEIVWTSVFLKMVAGSIILEKENTVLEQLRNVLEATGEGTLFEYVAHQNLSSSVEDAYPVIDLDDQQQQQQQQTITVPIHVKRVVLIRTISDIRLLKKGDYGLPTTSNFPLIDAIIDNVLIQFTVSSSHKGATDKLDDILVEMENNKNFVLSTTSSKKVKKSKPIMLFVVPEGKVCTFNKVSSLKNIKQCLTTDDLNALRNSQSSSRSAFKRIKI
jgi:hypothetical protein